MNDLFRQFSARVASVVGTAWAFILAAAVVFVWAVSGPAFGFSDTWQLVINTSTTIVTFLMVFLIQNTQNREARAIHLKLDELLKSASRARNSLLGLENLSDDELDGLQQEFARLQTRASAEKSSRRSAEPSKRVSRASSSRPSRAPRGK